MALGTMASGFRVKFVCGYYGGSETNENFETDKQSLSGV